MVLIPIVDLIDKVPDTNKIRAWNRQYNDNDSNSWSDLVGSKAPMMLTHALEHNPEGLYAVYPKGSGCIVVDVDVEKEGDSEEQKKLKSTRPFSIKEATFILEEAFKIKPFAVYKTTSGGVHLYYDCEPAVYDVLKDRARFRIRYLQDNHIMAGDVLLGNYAAIHVPIVKFAKSFREDSISFDVGCAENLLKAQKEREERKKGSLEKKGKGKKIRNVESIIDECLYTFGDNPAYVSDYDTWNVIVYCSCVAGSEYVNGEWRLNETVRKSIEHWNKGCPEKFNEDDVPRIWAENKNFDVSYRNGCLNRLRKEAGIPIPEGGRSGSLEITNELIDEVVSLVKGRFRFVCINRDTNTWRWYAYDPENTIWRRDDSFFGTSVREYIQSESENDALRESIMLPKGRSVLRCIEERSVMQSHIHLFNPNPNLLNLPGPEVFDTVSNTFLIGSADMLLTGSTSVAVNEEYLAKTVDGRDDVEQFVWDIMMPANEDEEECAARCEALQLLEGHMLCGHSTRAFQLQLGSSGGNGKTSYNQITGNALGSYAGSVSHGAVVGKNMQINPNTIGDTLIPLQGRMRSVILEAEGCISSVLKLLTGESSVSAPAKYQAVQDVKITTSIVLTANELPELSEVEPYRDRIFVVPFEQDFRNKPSLNLNLVDEFSTDERQKQVLRWLINGRRKQKKMGGPPKKPESWEIRTEGYLSGSDTAGGFVSETIEYDQDSILTWGEVLESAEHYYVDAGKLNKMRSLSKAVIKKYKARIESRFAGMKGFKITKRRVHGIRIVDVFQDAGRKASIAFGVESEDVRESLDTIQEDVQKVEPETECAYDEVVERVEPVVSRSII